MRGPLADKLNLTWLDRLARVKPDELAPSLGVVVAALAEKRLGDLTYANTSELLRLTQPTRNFKEILRMIRSALDERGRMTLFLDLDMGSGKTHLLTLILHLYAVCPEDPTFYRPLLEEYEREGCYSPRLAKDAVVLAFDLRVPRDVYRSPLKLLARQLERMGVKAEVIEKLKELAERGARPDYQWLAQAIPADKHVIVLVDELYHELIFARMIEDLRALEDFISFLKHFLDYRWQYVLNRSGLVVIVASARSDYERWRATFSGEPEKKLVAEFVDQFVRQLQRFSGVPGTEWLGLEDAKRIIERRLGCSYAQVFHESFDRLIARVIKADTDIPQAHHLRSLIKALAIFALNAANNGDRVVTPARFSGEVIDTLILDPEYKDLANIYRSHYEAAAEAARKLGRGEALLAANAVFALTLTGSEEKLIEMVRLAKVGRGPARDVPLVTAKELESILAALGVDQEEAAKALADIRLICPSIHSVRTADGGLAYFVAPAIDVRSYFLRLRDRLATELASSKRGELAGWFQSFLSSAPSSSSGNVSIQLVTGFERLGPLDPDKLHVFIYAEPGWLKSLFEASGEEERRALRERAVQEARRFLEDRRALNVVVVVPKVSEEVVRGLAGYQAAQRALHEVIEKYLRPMEEGRPIEEEGASPDAKRASETLRKLLEVELDDVKRELGEALADAVRALQRALRSMLSNALRHDGREVVEALLRYAGEEVAFRMPRTIAEVRERIVQAASNALVNTVDELADLAKSAIGFVDDPSKAADILYEYVSGELRRSRSVKVYFDARAIPAGGRLWYVPSRLIKDAAATLEGRLKSRLPEGAELRLIKEEDVVTFELVERQPIQPQPLSAPQPPIRAPEQPPVRVPVQPSRPPVAQPPPDPLKLVEEEMRRLGSGVLVVKLRFASDEISNLLLFLRAYKKLILDCEVKPAA
jgi:hypothetical protein